MTLDKEEFAQIEAFLVKAIRETFEKFFLPQFDKIHRIFEPKNDKREKKIDQIRT